MTTSIPNTTIMVTTTKKKGGVASTPFPKKENVALKVDFEKQKAELEAEKAELKAKQEAIEQLEKAEKERVKAEKTKQAIELRELATQYEIWAKEELRKPANEREFSTEHFLNLAKEARTNATVIEKELGLEVFEDVSDEPLVLNFKKTVLLQRVMLFALPVVSLIWFFILRVFILHENSLLAPNETDAATMPYGWDSIQKVAFSFFVRATDLLMLYGVLKVIAPVVPDYLIPNKKTPKDAIHEFYNDLTAWQRQLISVLLVASVLLYLALSPSVKA